MNKRLQSIGPAIIVAAVVCGPGSILSASKTGADFGYSMTWVIVLAVFLMIGSSALSARLGVF
ncbi:MAG: divalent metal cation transporter, partial [Verrucomicrobiota bacterium]|nr:divalent metal cation transporter [Verrucomicrobiota bacterium]